MKTNTTFPGGEIVKYFISLITLVVVSTTHAGPNTRCSTKLEMLKARALQEFSKHALKLRYHITVIGKKEAFGSQPKGQLILMNHPGPTDPLLVNSVLMRDVRPRYVMNEERATENALGRVAAIAAKAILIPEISNNTQTSENQVEQAADEVVAALKSGTNVVLYPSGRIYRSPYEHIGSNSFLEKVLSRYPNAPIVLGRTQGLYGSRFTYGFKNQYPDIGKEFKKGFFLTIVNLFNNPKRNVTITFQKPNDFPYQGDRYEQNKYLENWFNKGVVENTYVPYLAHHGNPHITVTSTDNKSAVPLSQDYPPQENAVAAGKVFLDDYFNHSLWKMDDDLDLDLGLDSLEKVRLIKTLENHFGIHPHPLSRYKTIRDLYAAIESKKLSVSPPEEYLGEETPENTTGVVR